MSRLDVKGKILVCCPGSTVPGGPELMHQLVNELRELNHEAYICYSPFEGKHDCPDAYKEYNAPQMRVSDEEGDLIILPEITTCFVMKIKRARVAIWWLSVDNYFRGCGESWVKDSFAKVKTLFRDRLPLICLRQCLHFTQSAYARNFLSRAFIPSMMLTDYLNLIHLKAKDGSICPKNNIIAYNPKKGASKTKAIIAANLNVNFVPIQGMTRDEVLTLLSTAKIYMDFGHHPGKDRLPREAAMAGCCIITGIQGSARNDEDVPIPSVYKLDDDCIPGGGFRSLVESIFNDFEQHNANFKEYRATIRNEPTAFRHQLDDIFGKR